MRMRDEKGQDDKLIAVHVDDPAFMEITDIAELPAHAMREVQRFFLDYKVLEGKQVVVDAPLGAKEALPILLDAIALYKKEAVRCATNRRAEQREKGCGKACAGPYAPGETRNPSRAV